MNSKQFYKSITWKVKKNHMTLYPCDRKKESSLISRSLDLVMTYLQA